MPSNIKTREKYTQGKRWESSIEKLVQRARWLFADTQNGFSWKDLSAKHSWELFREVLWAATHFAIRPKSIIFLPDTAHVVSSRVSMALVNSRNNTEFHLLFNLVLCSCFWVSGNMNQWRGGEVGLGPGTSCPLLVGSKVVLTPAVCAAWSRCSTSSRRHLLRGAGARPGKPKADSDACTSLHFLCARPDGAQRPSALPSWSKVMICFPKPRYLSKFTGEESSGNVHNADCCWLSGSSWFRPTQGS